MIDGILGSNTVLKPKFVPVSKNVQRCFTQGQRVSYIGKSNQNHKNKGNQKVLYVDLHKASKHKGRNHKNKGNQKVLCVDLHKASKRKG
jgi:hypothetical protein